MGLLLRRPPLACLVLGAQKQEVWVVIVALHAPVHLSHMEASTQLLKFLTG